MCNTKEELESNVARLRQREGDSRGGKAAEQEQKEQPRPGQRRQLPPARQTRPGRGAAAAFPVLFLAFLVQVTVRKTRT